ncbi:MAG: hypothetical protein Q8R26_03625, partial [bacterium]|nr:hypothetical protein [bacterium]
LLWFSSGRETPEGLSLFVVFLRTENVRSHPLFNSMKDLWPFTPAPAKRCQTDTFSIQILMYSLDRPTHTSGAVSFSIIAYYKILSTPT